MTVTSQPAYLYTMWNDKFNIVEGTVIICVDYRRPQARFDCTDKRDYTTVDINPGVIYQAKLWLTERDDELAKRKLREYHEKCIEELEKKIASHEKKLDILKGAK